MKYSFIIVIFLFFSCSRTVDSSYLLYNFFPKEKQLKARIVELDTALFRYPFRIKIKENIAIVMDLHNMDYYYHVFTYPGYKYITSFGKRGEAPEEMLSAENIRYLTDDEIWTLDANKNELIRMGFTKSINILTRKEVIHLDKGILRALDFAIYNDSTFIIPDYSGEHRFCWVNRKGKILRRSGMIPVKNKITNSSRPALAQAWRSFIDYNPRNGVLVAVTQLGEVLDIYNLKDGGHVVRVGPHGEPKFDISQGYAIPTGIMGFSDVCVTDNYIYTVFHGRTFKEIIQEKEQFSDGGEFIYVFSLKGEPICKYKLDRHIYGMQIDEKRGLITALDVNFDQPITEFEM